MSNLPNFTVILPVYNSGSFLPETLESVFAQTYPPTEVIVIDDGSTDRTLQMARAFEPRIRLISKANEGVSTTRNLGVSLASTEWVSFIDQDDIWLPEHLACQAQAIAACPQAEFCYSARRNLITASVGGWTLSEPIFPPPPADFRRVMLERCFITPSAVSIRRDTFLEVGGFDAKFNGVEDWNLWLRISQRGAVFVCSQRPTLHYRIHSGQESGNVMRMLEQTIRVIDENVLPFVPRPLRDTRRLRLVARVESEAAILMRERNHSGAILLIVRSLLRHPFFGIYRYKVFLHMLIFGSHQRKDGLVFEVK
jgi:glycosyltransferase involved in cell wall biosynthesis